MKLVLVRHGETLWNREKRVQGFSDVALSDLGLLQAERLAHCLRQERIEAIVSSPLIRARETARAIARFHNLSVEIDPDFRELNLGDFEGKTFTELMAEHAAFFQLWATDPASLTVPGGESLTDLQQRAWRAVERVITDAKDTIIVSHSFTIMTILCLMQGFGLERFRETHVDLASMTVVDVSNGQYGVILRNDTSHLREM